MAKLQGHFLRHREDPNDSIQTAKELLIDDLNQVQKEMSIEEWLHRLNLISLKDNFLKQKIRRVADLVYIID